MIAVVYDLLLKGFSILLSINVIVILCLSFVARVLKPHHNSTGKNTPDLSALSISLYGIIMILFSALSCIALVFILSDRLDFHWLLLPFIVLSFLRFFDYGLSSMKTVSSIIMDSASENLTILERSAIITIAAMFLLANQVKLPSILASWALDHQNSYLVDFAVCFMYAILYLVAFFLGISLLYAPLYLLAEIHIYLAARIPAPLKQKKLVESWENSPLRTKFLWTPFFSFSKNARTPWKQLLFLLTPFIIVLDYVGTMLLFFWVIIKEAFMYFFRILVHLAKFFHRFMLRIKAISDRQLVAISFRFATVFSIASVVIINRIDSIFNHAEACTAILEFVASAIVIPIIYVWINTWIEKRKTKQH